MKKILFALGVWFMAALPWAAIAQVPPTPPGVAVLAGAATLSVTATTGNVALPSNITPYNAVTVYNYGTKDAYFALGGSTVTATTSSFPVRAGTAISVWVGTNTWIAAITGGSDTTSLQIYQSNGALNFSALTGGGGGSGGVTSIAGTANQITASASTGPVTLSLPSAVLFPGTIQTSGQAIINLNAAMPPTPVTGTALQIVGANASNAFIENDSFGGTPILTGRRADGTGASPTTVQSGDVLGGFSARPYNGTAYTSASVANVQAVALENFTTGANGAYVQFNCTAITTLTTGECGRVTSTGFQGAIGATTASAGAFTTITNAGSLSGTATTTTGSRIIQGAATVTDTTSTGTVAADYINRFGITTLAASSATTYTNAYGSWFEPPAAGTNVTLTHAYAAGFNGSVQLPNSASFGLFFGPQNGPAIGGTSGGKSLVISPDNGQNVLAINSLATIYSVNVTNNAVFGFASGTSPNVAPAAGFSYGGAGIINVGTGAAGSTAGTVQATTFISAAGSNTTPSIDFGTANTGIYSRLTNAINISVGGVNTYEFSGSGQSVFGQNSQGGGAGIYFSPTNAQSATDSGVWRGGVNSVKIGGDGTNVAAPPAMSFGVEGVLNGTTNAVGALWKHVDSGGTGTGASGGYEFDVHPAGSTGSTPNAASSAFALSGAGAASLPLIGASSAAQTGTLCWTTGTGNITVDTTTTCLLSLEETKDIRADITPQEGIDDVMKLKPIWFSYKHGGAQTDFREHAGLGAHQVEGVDKRLVGYDANGKLQGVRYADSVTAANVAAIQYLKNENAELRSEIVEIRRKLNMPQTAANDNFFDRVGFALFGTR